MCALGIEFCATVPKEPEHPELNEDCVATDERGGRFALSDGASESYDSKRWAQLLTMRYLETPDLTFDWVKGAVRAYSQGVDFDSLSWAQQAAFDRGSFATLLTLSANVQTFELDVLSIGDCLAVHCVEGQICASFPFINSGEFQARPRLLSTRIEANAFVDHPDFHRRSRVAWPCIPGARVLLMTDALGQALLYDIESGGDMLLTLLGIAEQQEFEQFVLSLRAAKSIRLDDTTLVRLVVGPDQN